MWYDKKEERISSSLIRKTVNCIYPHETTTCHFFYMHLEAGAYVLLLYAPARICSQLFPHTWNRSTSHCIINTHTLVSTCQNEMTGEKYRLPRGTYLSNLGRVMVLLHCTLSCACFTGGSHQIGICHVLPKFHFFDMQHKCCHMSLTPINRGRVKAISKPTIASKKSDSHDCYSEPTYIQNLSISP